MYKFNKKEHAHTFEGKPLMGTTSIIGETLAKNGLTWWASGMAVSQMGWLHPRNNSKEYRIESAGKALEWIKEMDSTTYLELLDKAYKAHNEKKEVSADEGTDLHSKIEKYIKFCLDNNGEPRDYEEEDEKIKVFINWSLKNVKRFVWSEMNVYSERLWIGGITDFGFIDNNDELFIGDIKSSKEAYFSQFVQLALYHIQIEENGGFDSEGNKIYTLNKPIKGYAIFPFGNGVEPSYRYYSEAWRDVAEGVVKIYKLLNATK